MRGSKRSALPRRPALNGRAAAARALALVAALAACQRTAPTSPRALGAVGLAVDAPDDAVLAPADGGVTLTVHPGARSPTTLAVTRATVAPAGDRALVSAGGLRVRYAVGRWEGGSGGPEATVDATVHGGGGAWRVRCRAQSELGAPEDACLALLRSLRRWDTLAR